MQNVCFIEDEDGFLQKVLIKDWDKSKCLSDLKTTVDWKAVGEQIMEMPELYKKMMVMLMENKVAGLDVDDIKKSLETENEAEATDKE